MSINWEEELRAGVYLCVAEKRPRNETRLKWIDSWMEASPIQRRASIQDHHNVYKAGISLSLGFFKRRRPVIVDNGKVVKGSLFLESHRGALFQLK